MILYPLGISAKLVIRFEVRSFFKPRLFPKIQPPRYSGQALHGPKGDRINESLL